ncbi:hypothetical protein H072_5339 [Dactylellina haptotyla CBS 200.50]|uniref:SWIM-type domain-containing protein n=1 Tax=Dactylellina haptotyla (strain CBS 200.50) TaxID=1284197 RepID=S8BZK1_DACHA|nr:hypothetical protein H072_5339 [Dactylellina haptotyla CBS 200.50]
MPPRRSPRKAPANNASPPYEVTAPAKSPRAKRKREPEAVEPEPTPKTVRKSTSTSKAKSKPAAAKEPENTEEPVALEEPEETEEPAEPPRLKKFRAKCPQAVEQRLDRVRTQRIFCLGRERDEENLTEDFKIAGSTGNVYTVVLANIPTCNCPDGKKNGTCKHILFVMSKVLRARYDLTYQMALLNSEIKEIFAKSPILVGGDTTCEKRKRKPLDQDECPVCYEAFDPADTSILFCTAQCGSNIHKDCFRQWAASKGGGRVTCVMCRTPWEEGAVSEGDYGQILQDAKVGYEGYLNVGAEMGMSNYRDTSSYHRFYSGYRKRWY